MERDDVEREAVAVGYEAAHLDVLLCGAVALAVVETDAYIEKVQVMTLFEQTVHCYCTVDPS